MFLVGLHCVHLEFGATKPQKQPDVGGMSQLHSSSAVGADESQYYTMQLALTRGTSDGRRGPSPGCGVTHWIWRSPNMFRQKEFHRNAKALLLEMAAMVNICGT